MTDIGERRGVGIGGKRLACRRAALDVEGIGHVLADAADLYSSPSFPGQGDHVKPRGGASCPVLIVAEVNQGGKMVESVLRAAGPGLRLKLVRASEGKSARAEPVALLFEAGRVRVHGRMAKLEASRFASARDLAEGETAPLQSLVHLTRAFARSERTRGGEVGPQEPALITAAANRTE